MTMSLNLNRNHFINHYPPFNIINTTEVKDMSAKEDLHLYVHIPFCPHKCGYCYYKSFDTHTPELISGYLESLKKEILIYSQQPEVRKKQIKSLYFGGGTPTILSCKQYEDLVTYILDKFKFREDFEFCSEARPHEKTLTPEKLKLMKSLGVNRLSMGMQNLSNNILEMNKRDARVEFYYNVYQMAMELEFENINIDIMTGMYGETWDNWMDVISKLIQWAPPSIAFYKMELFYNTRLFKNMKNRNQNITLMSDEEEIKCIRCAHDRLREEGGYIVINCLHLLRDLKFEHVQAKGLWDGEEMRGLGITSHSCCDGFFYQNTSNLNEYHRMIKEGKLPVKRAHRMTVKEFISQTMVYGIKNLCVDRVAFNKKFGFDFTEFYGDIIDEYIKKGVLILDEEALRVTKEYYIFADDICRLFFLPEYETMMLAHVKRG